MQFWLDGRKVVHVTGRAREANACRGNDLQDEWRAPPKFDSFYIGFERYADSANDQNLWIDDVALSKQRVGCRCDRHRKGRRESMKFLESCGRGVDAPLRFRHWPRKHRSPRQRQRLCLLPQPCPFRAPPLVDPAAIDSALKHMIDSKKIIGVSALVYERGKEVVLRRVRSRRSRKQQTDGARHRRADLLHDQAGDRRSAHAAVRTRQVRSRRAALGLPAGIRRSSRLRRAGWQRRAEIRSAEAADHRARHPAPYGGLPRRWIAGGSHGYLPAGCGARFQHRVARGVRAAGQGSVELSARHAVEIQRRRRRAGLPRAEDLRRALRRISRSCTSSVRWA